MGKEFNYNIDRSEDIDFGDYVIIEQLNYVIENEMYLHKVVNRLKSNYFVDVPVQIPRKEILHNDIVEVISCICCGIEETQVLKYKVEDVKLSKNKQS